MQTDFLADTDPRLEHKELSITPTTHVASTVNIPGSKSYTNRAIIISALAKGETVLEHPLISEDTTYLADAVTKFGCTDLVVDQAKDKIHVICGQGPLVAPRNHIFMGNAGTPIRCLTSYASLAEGTTVITGDKRMQQRPIEDLINGLQQLGVTIKDVRNSGSPPVEVKGPSLRGGTAHIRGSVSSQFTTSILLSAPYADKGVELRITDDLTSKPYVDMTLAIMKAFGVDVERDGYTWFQVKANQEYRAHRYRIEPDASNMSYFLAASAILGGRVHVPGIDRSSVQGDVRFLDVLERMGCTTKSEPGYIELVGGELFGIDVDMNWMPDLVPTLAIVAAFADGRTHITNIANLRVKECDRIAAMETELSKMGIQTESTVDTLTIYGGLPSPAIIDTYNDHRIAMSFAVAGLRVPGVTIRNPGCVAKSFPSFWRVLDQFRGAK